MNVLVFANGDGPAEGWGWVRPLISTSTILIAADGGARHIAAMGLSPDIIIGDLDSLAKEKPTSGTSEAGSLLTFSQEKDESDLELALIHAASLNPDSIQILAAVGGRLDQTLSNALLLSLPELSGLDVFIVQPHQRARRIEGRVRIEGDIGDLISLVPLWGPARVEKTDGLKWSLADEKLIPGPARGISNQLIEPAGHITLSSGSLLCVHTERAWSR